LLEASRQWWVNDVGFCGEVAEMGLRTSCPERYKMLFYCPKLGCVQWFGRSEAVKKVTNFEVMNQVLLQISVMSTFIDIFVDTVFT